MSDDLISRQDAIDAVKKLVEWYKEKWHESRPTSESVIDVLNDLPSAQSERKNEPVGCNGCRYDWLGDPRCAKCARSFQDHYEAERKES